MAVRQEQLAASQPRVHFIDRMLRVLSSVKLGITLMMVLIFFSVLGTVIIQHNLDKFDQFYAALTPAEKQLYHTLGLFDLFHTWWFNTLLILFSLNLILVSIDLWPKAWRFLTEPKINAGPGFLANQPWYQVYRVRPGEDAKSKLEALLRAGRLRVSVNTKDGFTTVFGQRGVWNRFVVFVIHIAVLMILGAGFVGSRWGYEGMIALSPGLASNELFIRGNETLKIPDAKRMMPFQLYCEKIRVDLKDPKGPLTNQNTVNWFTHVKIQDPEEPAPISDVVRVNGPLDHAGYRFFQSGPGRPGDASDVKLEVQSADGTAREVQLERNKPTKVEGVGEVVFSRFLSDMRIMSGRPQSASEEYNNPAAELQIVDDSGDRSTIWAFNAELSDFLEKEGRLPETALKVNGHRFVLKDYLKVGQEHVLQVQYDPGVGTIYLGFILLCSALIAGFSFSHDRVWGVVEDRGEDTYLHLAAHTSRNRASMEKRFEQLSEQLKPAIAPLPGDEASRIRRTGEASAEDDANSSD
ncbi:MAG: cytochrome c biogenesis protein ResB [Acidobacteria bacterium]|nr:cytochrome c biogenesis protein ResB [Acidobacteriota bacterium]